MAEEVKTIGGQPAAPQPGTVQPRPCPQDCTKCMMPQQIFCAVKMLFELSRSQQQLRSQVEELSKSVGTIQDQMKLKEAGGQLSIPFVNQG